MDTDFSDNFKVSGKFSIKKTSTAYKGKLTKEEGEQMLIQEKEKLRELKKMPTTPFLDITYSYAKLSDDPLEILIEKEKFEAAQKAIEMLTDEHKHIIQLRLNGVKSADISKLMGNTANAVDCIYYRAIKQGRENFKKIYYGVTDFSNFVIN